VEDSFKLLEERVRRAAERLKELQSENESLRKDLGESDARAEKAEKKLEEVAEAEVSRESASKKAETLARELKGLRKEREEIRTRLGRLLENLE